MFTLLAVNPWLIVVAAAILAVYVYRYMKQTYSTLERLGIPHPKPMWIFGNVKEFQGKNVLSVFKEWKKKYGNVYGFYEGFRPGIVLNDAEFARDVLNRHFEKFHARTSYRPFVYYPDNLRLIELDGNHWKNQRAIINKMLNSTGTLKCVAEKVNSASASMLTAIEKEREIAKDALNVSRHIDKFVSESVMRIVLGMDDDDIGQHGEAIHNYEILSNMSSSSENQLGGLARLFPTLTPLLKLGDRKHKQSHEEVVDILRTYLSSALTGQNNNKIHDDDHTSLLSFLLSSKILKRDIDGSLTRREFSTDETIAHILSLLSEMYSTTTAIIQFLLYELARNLQCQQKLYTEICESSGKDDSISLQQLQNLEYFDMFFNETYRHHPVAPGVSRICTESCKIRGINFEKGMVVRVMTSPMYQDENLFPEPDKFYPERFSKENRASAHQYTFLPFGQGPRMCPGQKLASILVKTAVIKILKKYSLNTCSKTEIPLKEALRPSLTPANGVCVRLAERT